MAFVPHFKLYASDGNTLLYTFIAVQSTNAPQTVKKSTTVEGIRGQGCIVIPGSDSSWTLEINGVLLADNYTALTVLIDALEGALVMFTNYIIIFNKSINTSYTYNVQRTEPISYPASLRTDYQEYQVKLKVGAW